MPSPIASKTCEQSNSSGKISPTKAKALATKIRGHVLKMTSRAKSSHVGAALSIADIVAVLYTDILNVRPSQPDWPQRDRFILSKGHGCTSLYAALSEGGFFPLSWLDNYYQNGSRLAGHATRHGVPGVDLSTGSLGHGLSVACGMALSAQKDGAPFRVFAVLSDGDCQEGSTWEAVLFGAHHKLDNLVAIVDYNKFVSWAPTKEVLNLDPLAEKWRAFGWSVREVDGHNIEQLEQNLKAIPFEPGLPSCVIAHTTKGKGVSFMENKFIWHYKAPDDNELKQALSELELCP